MTLKELAHAAQQMLQTGAGGDVKRSHVHELLAAAFGYSSWAAFRCESVLADGGVGQAPSSAFPLVAARGIHLRYAPDVASRVAAALLEFLSDCQVRAIPRAELQKLLLPAVRKSDDERFADEDEWDDEDFEEHDETLSSSADGGLTRDHLLQSPMLLRILEDEANAADPTAHHLLAALYRCRRTSPYLYEQSLQGRQLTAVEQRWVDEHLRLEPQFRLYEAHLRAAALAGARAAALEYAKVFDSREFFELAERLPGEVDAASMVRIAPTRDLRAPWLRRAAEQGSRSALEELAAYGEEWAQERLAESGDANWLRAAAERALANGDALKAWMWQYLALAHGEDLTVSTMAAYHDGGQHDGEFYDSDFGGAAYADGVEGLALPTLGADAHRIASDQARAILARML